MKRDPGDLTKLTPKCYRLFYNLSGHEHIWNKRLYGSLQRIILVVKYRCLALVGHVSRQNEPINEVLLWRPEAKR